MVLVKLSKWLQLYSSRAPRLATTFVPFCGRAAPDLFDNRYSTVYFFTYLDISWCRLCSGYSITWENDGSFPSPIVIPWDFLKKGTMTIKIAFQQLSAPLPPLFSKHTSFIQIVQNINRRYILSAFPNYFSHSQWSFMSNWSTDKYFSSQHANSTASFHGHTMLLFWRIPTLKSITAVWLQ